MDKNSYQFKHKNCFLSKFSAKNIDKQLRNSNYEIIFLKKTTSTNDYLKNLAQKGAKEGVVVVAKKQTKGRGRQNKSFYSPKNHGLYFSILLRPQVAIESANAITILATSALWKVLSKYNKNITIKWVNDLFICDKKFVGILTESSVDTSNIDANYIVLGIGINLTPPKSGFPKEIKQIATTLFDKKCNNNIKCSIIASVIEQIFIYYQNMQDKSYMDIYKNNQYLSGKKVDIYQLDKKIDSGFVLGVDDNGKLLVDCGKIIALNSGYVKLSTD